MKISKITAIIASCAFVLFAQCYAEKQLASIGVKDAQQLASIGVKDAQQLASIGVKDAQQLASIGVKDAQQLASIGVVNQSDLVITAGLGVLDKLVIAHIVHDSDFVQVI